jgi:hypothetical protein
MRALDELATFLCDPAGVRASVRYCTRRFRFWA